MEKTQSETRKRYDFDRVVRLVITIVCVAVAIYVINYLSGVLLPFLIGGVLAYMLNPLVELIRRVLHLKGRAVASVLAIIIAVATITALLYFLIPYLIDEFAYMGKLLTDYATKSLNDNHVPAAVNAFFRKHVDFNQLSKMLTKEQWMSLAQNIANGTWSVVAGTFDFIVGLVVVLMVLLYMFFILLDYDKITRGFKAAVPPKYRRLAFRMMRDVEQTMSRYFRGQAMVSLLVGITFAVMFYIIGLPMAIVFGLLIGVLNMVPYLQLTSIPVAAFLCLVASVATGGSFWALAGWTFLAYCGCQALQDMVYIPMIMKQQMGLNPAIIFLSLSIWGYVLGFVGLIIALPLTTLIISYYSEFVLGRPNPLYATYKPKNKKRQQRNKTIPQTVTEQ